RDRAARVCVDFVFQVDFCFQPFKTGGSNMRVQTRWIVVVLVLVALLVTACQPVATAPAADGGVAASAEPVVLTFSSQSVPDDAHTKAMDIFAEEVSKLTNGEVTVEVYPGGQLFTQDAELPAVVSGNLDMAYFDPN